MNDPKHRTWKLTKPAFSRHYNITSSYSPSSYIVDISVFTKNKPNLTLHSGSSLKTSSSTLACVFTPKASRSFTLGIGDPASPGIQWEEFRRDGMMTYTFPCIISGAQKQLTWKRTAHESVEGMKASRFGKRDFKLVDEAGIVLAVFTHEFGVGNCGTLEVRGDWGEQFDLKVLMGVVALYDIARKRQNAAGAGAGGGASC